MSSNKSKINDISGRIISLSALYSTNKEFLEKCGISNYSLITDLKKGRIKNPGADILAMIVGGTGCNGSWLLTGEGSMFGNDKDLSFGNGMTQAMFKGTINLIKEIEQEMDLSNGVEPPDDMDLQLVKLLYKIIEQRHRQGN